MYIDLISLINIATCIVILATVYIRYLKSNKIINLFDPLYLFLGFAFLYSVAGQYNKIDLDNFSSSVYLISSLSVFLFFMCFFIFSLFSEAPGEIQLKDQKILKTYSSLFFISGLISTIIGYIFLYYNYSRLGGFFEILLSFENRTDRNSSLTELRGNLPFTHFIFTGAMLLLASFLAKENSIRRSILLTFIVISPLFLFYIIDGERTAILKYIVGGFFVTVAFSFRKPVTLKSKYIAFFTVFFLVFSFLGNMRAYIGYSIFTGDFGPIERRLNGVYGDAGLALFIPKEFPAVNYTLNRSVHEKKENGTIQKNGRTYLSSFPYLFPRSVYDGFGLQKSPTIADTLGEEVRLELGRKRKVGLGMSPLAESIINFGFFGPAIFALAIIFWIQTTIRLINSKSPLIVLWICMQTPTLFLINRIAFASFFSYVVWVSLVLFFSYIAALFTDYLLPKKYK